MRPLALLLFVALSSACARDCATLVERRCRATDLDEDACAQFMQRAAAVPPQACEAVLQALETPRAPR